MTRRKIAVAGAGWAGCAAALELAHAGCAVTLLESARTLGGRARRVEVDGHQLDNGQHIMLGAYAASLRVMKLAGIDMKQAVLTLPLQMRYPPGSGGMDFLAPRLPAPLHLLGALLRATGLAREDKLSLARFSTTARWMDWQLNADCSVNELLLRFDQTPRLIQLMWRPLCLAALNTPPERASAQVFLNVLRDSLGARRQASDMLIPRADLSALFPEAAAACVTQRGGSVQLGAKVAALTPLPGGRWHVAATGSALGGAWGEDYDAVVLATGAPGSAALLRDLLARSAPGTVADTRAAATSGAAALTAYLTAVPAAASGAAALTAYLTAVPAAASGAATPVPALAGALASAPGQPAAGSPIGAAQREALLVQTGQLEAFEHEAITTCYLQYAPGVRLDLPFYALLDDPLVQHWGQFVFDRGQLDNNQQGMLAVVISASASAAQFGQAALASAIAAQLAAVLRRPELAEPSWSRVITEKRATYACSPGLARPDNATALPGLLLAGDYTAGDYPATLEGAVRSGVAAAKKLLSK
ncbi:FAD-dependent oxidoreductase [Pseudoduganella sp. LjRoot289]|uniref:hydroxysqualene dehydroxylase n=1 Tax=Pseudoduganella sp. LjRoot289 TaxID=3342314 RepID=UPI003ED0F36E